MTEPGKNAPGLVGFPTPNAADDLEGYLLFYFPDQTWAQYILGACRNLTYDFNWYESGDLTPEEIAQQFDIIVQEAPYNLLPDADIQTPFWDDEDDVDDSEPPDMQPWYGEVSNPTAPPGELDFVENILLWAFTGLIAVATFEVAGVAPAILFHTTVEKFIITQKRGDVAETIRFVIDNQDIVTIDTTPYSPGELIETTLLAPPGGGTHDVLIIGGSS